MHGCLSELLYEEEEEERPRMNLKDREKRGGGILGRRTVAPDHRNNNRRRRGQKQPGVICADLFITTAPSLSPSQTANANVGHLGQK